MYAILIRLILLAALMELGMSLSEFGQCDSRECLARVEKASRKALKIDWRSIRIFGREENKFR